MRFLNRNSQALIVLILLYAYLTYQHIERMIHAYGEWGGEITSFTMNLVCRLISVAFCFKDGAENVKRGVKEMPSFMDLLGYTFNTPSCVAGPFFEFRDYEDWIKLEGDYKNLPDTVKPGCKRMGTSLIWM